MNGNKNKNNNEEKKKELKINTYSNEAFPDGFEILKQNIYVERKKIKLSEEDIAVCHCFFIPDEPACGLGCINRMMFYECTPGYCPCGERCTNQRFQRAEYAKVEPFKTQKKGWGLKILENIKEGDFIIEYIGEVISNDECLKRMKKIENDNKFYFLTLDSSECIDARRKGNLARFINHSCNPNCKTEKWNVLGEIRVGIFALKDIVAGTELTFDYQFERFGVKKQPCYCGENNCRGFLGEKPKLLLKTTNKEDNSNFSNFMESQKKSTTIFVDPQKNVNNLFIVEPRKFFLRKLRFQKSIPQGYIGFQDFHKYRCEKLQSFPFLWRNVQKSKSLLLRYFKNIFEEMLEEEGINLNM